MIQRAAIALGLLAGSILGSAADATTFKLSSGGFTQYAPGRPVGTVTLSEVGLGSFDLATDNGTATLASGLAAFSFTTSVTAGGISSGTTSVTYTLSDLNSFSATVVNGVIASFGFTTKTKSAYYGGSSTVAYVASAGSSNVDYGTSILSGLPNVSGSISATPLPEPASWAMMLAGFGLVGGVARSRRRMPARFG